ncbi:MAG: hypothetical protein ACYDCW_06760 [Acidithiobacillus ferrivorans]
MLWTFHSPSFPLMVGVSSLKDDAVMRPPAMIAYSCINIGCSVVYRVTVGLIAAAFAVNYPTTNGNELTENGSLTLFTEVCCR